MVGLMMFIAELFLHAIWAFFAKLFSQARCRIGEIFDQKLKMSTLMQRFPNAFPEHNDKELYGVIATVDASSEIKQEVLNAGIYLAQINDEQFILNPPERFKPHQFNPLH